MTRLRIFTLHAGLYKKVGPIPSQEPARPCGYCPIATRNQFGLYRPKFPSDKAKSDNGGGPFVRVWAGSCR
jgi:hypothetical protein